MSPVPVLATATELLSRDVAGAALWKWTALAVVLLLGLGARCAVRHLGRWTARKIHDSPQEGDEILLERLTPPAALLAAVALCSAAISLLGFSGAPRGFLDGTFRVLLFFALTWAGYRMSDMVGRTLEKQSNRGDDSLDPALVRLTTRTLKGIVIVFGILLTAQNFGVQVFSLIAGLGIGGLAVALAAQDTLANFFGSIMIMIDRPFRTGHWVVIKEHEGIVEEIGFRSTRLRTFYDSVISIPNKEVAACAVDNMGLRHYRRVRTLIGISYDTRAEHLEAFLEGIKNIIKAHPHTRKDLFQVSFQDFAADNLAILVYFYVNAGDWGHELLYRQQVFLEILRLAQHLGIQFAFPTQTVHIESFPGQPPPARPEHPDFSTLRQSTAAFGPGGTASRPSGSGLFTAPCDDPSVR